MGSQVYFWYLIAQAIQKQLGGRKKRKNNQYFRIQMIPWSSRLPQLVDSWKLNVSMICQSGASPISGRFQVSRKIKVWSKWVQNTVKMGLKWGQNWVKIESKWWKIWVKWYQHGVNMGSKLVKILFCLVLFGTLWYYFFVIGFIDSIWYLFVEFVL